MSEKSYLVLALGNLLGTVPATSPTEAAHQVLQNKSVQPVARWLEVYEIVEGACFISTRQVQRECGLLSESSRICDERKTR